MTKIETCPCNSGRTYNDCCEPILSGELHAPTAEALMRSRYSAYVVGNLSYLKESLHPKRRSDYDEQSAREWSEGAEWKGLEVIRTEAGDESDETGTVEFKARFAVDGQDHEHHELAEFRKDDGRWYFWDGKNPSVKTIVRDAPKIGRNDPCSCGSGKKYKKCCG